MIGEPLCVDLPPAERAEIDRIAKRDMVTPETVVERAVTEWLRITVGQIDGRRPRDSRELSGARPLDSGREGKE